MPPLASPPLRRTSPLAAALSALSVVVLFGLALPGCMQRHRVQLVQAPARGEVAPIVKRELERARRDGYQLLVYVGATWCEPCERFRHAAASGELDQAFPTLRLLTFDEDRDAERLARAGYHSTYIPLFVVPRPDGTSSGRQIEGSVKGAGAVAQIAPRLRALVGK